MLSTHSYFTRRIGNLSKIDRQFPLQPASMGTMHLGVQLCKDINAPTMQTLVARSVLNSETITILVRLQESIKTLLTNQDIMSQGVRMIPWKVLGPGDDNSESTYCKVLHFNSVVIQEKPTCIMSFNKFNNS